MILFIASEVMFFSGLFAAYFNVRAGRLWPPEGYRDILHDLPIALPATLVLILSSVTCYLAHRAIVRDDRRGFVRAFTITFVLGIFFLAAQLFDYTQLYAEGLRLDSGVFGTTFYTLTGFHGAHVFAGVVMLGVVLYRGMIGQFSSKHYDAVLATSLYWHFVDIVWVVLFSVLYVL